MDGGLLESLQQLLKSPKIIKMALLSFLKTKIRKLKLQSKTPEQIFSDYAKKNKWRGGASLSGKGSSLEATAGIRAKLPSLYKELNVKTLLDLPCGDFYWMSHVDMSGFDYLGGDIVGDLIDKNNSIYSNNHIHFAKINIIEDRIPSRDLILVRDCLVHFSSEHILQALNNIAASGSRWLLTTTFPEIKENINILTGEWRAINLTLPPYSLPAPTKLIREGQSWIRGQMPGKALGLWDIRKVNEALKILP